MDWISVSAENQALFGKIYKTKGTMIVSLWTRPIKKDPDAYSYSFSNSLMSNFSQ